MPIESVRGGVIRKIAFAPILLGYRFFFQWLLGIDIPEQTLIGDNFVIWHGCGLVIHPKVIIGNNVLLRQNTTIGKKNKNGGVPIIEDNVEIGAGAIVIGDITIGHHSIIGAGAIITKSLAPYSCVMLDVSTKIKTLKEDCNCPIKPIAEK